MPQKVTLKTDLPVNAWQCLVAMAAEDLREPGDFVNWLVNREAKRRGLLAAEAQPVKAQPEGGSDERQN